MIEALKFAGFVLLCVLIGIGFMLCICLGIASQRIKVENDKKEKK